MRAVKELKSKYNKLKREQKIKFLMDLFINITLDDEDAADIGYVPRKEAAFIFTDPAPKRNDVINNLMKTQQVEQRQTTANQFVNSLLSSYPVTYNEIPRSNSGLGGWK